MNTKLVESIVQIVLSLIILPGADEIKASAEGGFLQDGKADISS